MVIIKPPKYSRKAGFQQLRPIQFSPILRSVRVSLEAILVSSVALVLLTSCATPPVVLTPTLASKPASTSLPSVTVTPGSATAPVATTLATAPKPTVDIDDVRLWGTELTLDEFVAMAKSGKVDYIEWFMEYDRLRVFTLEGSKYNYRNEKTKLDMARYLEEHGVKIGDGGVQLNYET